MRTGFTGPQAERNIQRMQEHSLTELVLSRDPEKRKTILRGMIQDLDLVDANAKRSVDNCRCPTPGCEVCIAQNNLRLLLADARRQATTALEEEERFS
jgi:hypothetical protein